MTLHTLRPHRWAVIRLMRPSQHDAGEPVWWVFPPVADPACDDQLDAAVGFVTHAEAITAAQRWAAA